MKAAALFLAVLILPAQACIWDRDTLAMEKARFPEVADLIAGKFPRHSREFYEWRQKQAEAQIAKDAKDTGAYDDLAVAQHKLGDHKAAIETMLKKEAAVPGLYETYSNLGTFFIYTGDLQESLKWIDKALEINPNAHFGREKYQRWLVEWALSGRRQTAGREFMPEFGGFALFVAEKTEYKGKPTEWNEGRAEALKGITGMMRFADFDNPLLLEALGDVLMVGKLKDNAAFLAAQAYLLASRRSTAESERQRLLQLMEAAGELHDDFKPQTAAKELDAALESGKVYVNRVWADERAWIAEGGDVEGKFEKKYLTPGKKR